MSGMGMGMGYGLAAAVLALTYASVGHAVHGLDASLVLGNASFPHTSVGPYSWKYYTADVPPQTSQLRFRFQRYWEDATNASGPVVCFSVGGPSVPSEPLLPSESLTAAAAAAASALGSSAKNKNVSAGVGHCAMFLDHEDLVLNATTTASPNALPSLGGLWYVGVFSIADSSRFQSQMIARGATYSFDLSIVSYACMGGSLGLFCDQPVTFLPINPKPAVATDAPVADQGLHATFTAWRQLTGQCLVSPPDSPAGRSEGAETQAPGDGAGRAAYTFELTSPTPLLELNIAVDPTHSLSSFAWAAASLLQGQTVGLNASLMHLGPLPTRRPRIDIGFQANLTDLDAGSWLLVVHPSGAAPASSLCFSLSWRVLVCDEGWVGPQCQHPLHQLQRLVPGSQPESTLDSVFSPPLRVHWTPGLWGSWFPLPPPGDGRSPSPSPLNASEPGAPSPPPSGESITAGTGWAFVALDVPQGATGGVLSLSLKRPEVSGLKAFWANTSDSVNVSVLGRRGGVPSPEEYDVTAAGNLLKGSVSLDVLYPAAGKWLFGVRVQAPSMSLEQEEAELASLQLRFALHGCAGHCSWHGSCRAMADEAQLYAISYCYCDRTHGGHDCSVVLQTEKKHERAVYALVISNAAAAIPAAWAFYHQEYAEWIVYSTAGAMSALYHSCDAGGWCAARYSTLQFADFFLSFLAVLATFVYCASLPARSKLAFSLSTTILAAVIARDNTTSGWNLIVVIALGACGLLLGWLLAFIPGCRLRHKARPQGEAGTRAVHQSATIKHLAQRCARGLSGLVLSVWRRFHKGYLAAGLLVLSLAGVGWFTETGGTYWFWHSTFHVCIFTSAFLFLESVLDTEGPKGQGLEMGPQRYTDTSTGPTGVGSQLHNGAGGDVESEDAPLMASSS